MTRHKYICIVCGKGFLATNTQISVAANMAILAFCKKKCAMKHYSKDWKPGLFKSRKVKKSALAV